MNSTLNNKEGLYGITTNIEGKFVRYILGWLKAEMDQGLRLILCIIFTKMATRSDEKVRF